MFCHSFTASLRILPSDTSISHHSSDVNFAVSPLHSNRFEIKRKLLKREKEEQKDTGA
jgi:hypothetical protein